AELDAARDEVVVERVEVVDVQCEVPAAVVRRLGAGGASLAPLVLEQLDLDVAAGDAQERDVPGRRVRDGHDLGDLALLVQRPDPQLEAELSAVEVERAVEVRDRDARVPRAVDGPAHGWTILRRRERSTPRRTGEAVLRWGDGLVGRRPRGARRR